MTKSEIYKEMAKVYGESAKEYISGDYPNPAANARNFARVAARLAIKSMSRRCGRVSGHLISLMMNAKISP